jgi:methylmalonyl-CoA/ethylmalonyl-CoA epimerase
VAGYHASEVVIDTIQQVKVCFLSKDGEPYIELIEPLDENSHVDKILQKNKGVTTPYHLCYEADNIDVVFDILVEMGYTPLFRPIEAIALGNRQICYFYKKEI